jgi:hypothetical protein
MEIMVFEAYGVNSSNFAASWTLTIKALTVRIYKSDTLLHSYPYTMNNSYKYTVGTNGSTQKQSRFGKTNF